MLDQSDILNCRKPLLAGFLFKFLFFLTTLIFLTAKKITGFQSTQASISHCSNYINLKSQFINIALATQFISILFCILLAITSLTIYSSFLLILRKPLSKSKQKIRLSQNQIIFFFISSFIQTIFILNIIIRSIQKIQQLQQCNQNYSNFIVLLVFSALELCFETATLVILFWFVGKMKKKTKNLQDFNFYSDKINFQQNLLFNKTEQFFNSQKYSSQSNGLKQQLIRQMPSGYKKRFDYSPTREILHRLRGGSKNSEIGKSMSKGKILQSSKKADNLIQFLFKSSNQKNANTKKQNEQYMQKSDHKQQQIQVQCDLKNIDEFLQNQSLKKTSTHMDKIVNTNLLSVLPKFYEENPNEENYQRVELTLNVLQLSIDPKSLQTKSDQDNEENQDEQKYLDEQLDFLKKKGYDTSDHNRLILFKTEEELKSKFNLTPNLELRAQYDGLQNFQNLDANGNYYFVDVQKIKKKTRLLDFQKIVNDTQQVDYNTLYAKKAWRPKQKRIWKKHQKIITEQLQNFSKIRKQETLRQKIDSDLHSENFQSNSLSTQYSGSNQDLGESVALSKPIKQNKLENFPENQNPVNPQKSPKIQPQSQMNQQEKTKVKKKQKPKPQLFLHFKNKRKTKLSLFQYQDQFHQSKNFTENQPEDRQAILWQKTGPQKNSFTNKKCLTKQAKMLRFLRKKYRLSELDKKQSKNSPDIIFDQGDNQYQFRQQG